MSLILCLGLVAAAVLVALVAVRPAPARGAAPRQPEGDLRLWPHDQLGGFAGGVALEGSRAYLGLGRRLVVLDVADPSTIRELGRSAELDGPVTGVVALGGGWVAVGDGGAATTGKLIYAAVPRNIEVVDNFVGHPLAARNGILHVAAEAHLVSYDLRGGRLEPLGVEVFGGRVLAMEPLGEGWLVLADDDLDDRDPPASLRFLDTPSTGTPRKRHTIALPEGGLDLAVAGDVAYALTAEALRVFELGAGGEARELGRAYIASDLCHSDLAAVPPYVLLTDRCSESLRIVDVSQLEAPRVVASLPLAGSEAHLARLGTRLFVAAGTAGALEVLDVSDPSASRPLGRWLSVGEAWGLSLQGDDLFVAEVYSGFQVVDARPAFRYRSRGRLAPQLDPEPARGPARSAAPRHPSGPSLAQSPSSSIVLPIGPRPIVQRPGQIAVVEAPFGQYPRLQVVDVADPDAPRRLGSAQLARASRLPLLAGRPDLLMAFNGNSSAVGLQAVDWRNAAAPRLASWLPLDLAEASQTGVAVDGRQAFVAGGPFQVVEAGDPDALRAVASIGDDLLGPVTVIGRRAYVAARRTDTLPERLAVIDLTDPERPRQVAAPSLPLDPMYEADGLKECLGRLAVWSEDRLALYDLADPDAPRLAGAYDNPTGRYDEGIADLACRDDPGTPDHVFLAHERRGVVVLDLYPADVAVDPPPTFTPVPRTPPPATWPSPTPTARSPRSRLFLPLVGRATWRDDAAGAPALAGTFGGLTQAAATDGRLLWLGVGERVHVVDAGQPLGQQLLAQSEPLGELPRALALAGDAVWIAAGGQGLVALSAKPSEAPRRLSRLPLAGPALGVAVAGRHAFVAMGDAGLAVVDIAQPGRPEVVGTLEWDGPRHLGATDLVLSGDLLLVVDRDGGNSPQVEDKTGVWVIDVAEPGRPVVRARIDLNYPGRVALSGTTALASYSGGHLAAFDLSEPDEPRKIGERIVDSVDALAFVGRHALMLRDDSEGSELSVLDLTRLAGSPGPVIGTLTLPSGVAGLSVAGERAVLAFNGPGAGARIVDVSRPEAPADLGGYLTPQDIGGLAVAGDHLLAVEGPWTNGRLWSLNASEPGQLRPAALMEDLGWPVAGPVVSGDRAFVASNEAGLQVFGIADPARPERIAAADLPGQPYCLVLADRFAVALLNVPGPDHDTGVLAAVDLRDPARTGGPTTLHIDDEAVDESTPLAAAGRTIYVGGARFVGDDVDYAAHAYRIDDAAGALTDLGPIAGISNCRVLASDGRHLYCGDSDHHLVVLDLEEPETPRVVGSLALDNPVTAIALRGSTVYLVTWPGQLVEVDAADPARLRIRSRRNLPDVLTQGLAYGMAFMGERLFVGTDTFSSAGGIAEYELARRW